MTFGSDRRVLKRPHFQAIQRVGRRVSTKHFVLIISQGSDPQALSRIGITASKKVGNAVVRNRMKRIVRAAFRETDGLLPNGFEMVVICKMAPPELTSGTVVQEWRGAKKRVEKTVAQLRSGAPRQDRPNRRS